MFQSFIFVSKVVHKFRNFDMCGYSTCTPHAGKDTARSRLQWSAACSKYVCPCMYHICNLL